MISYVYPDGKSYPIAAIAPTIPRGPFIARPFISYFFINFNADSIFNIFFTAFLENSTISAGTSFPLSIKTAGLVFGWFISDNLNTISAATSKYFLSFPASTINVAESAAFPLVLYGQEGFNLTKFGKP